MLGLIKLNYKTQICMHVAHCVDQLCMHITFHIHGILIEQKRSKYGIRGA